MGKSLIKRSVSGSIWSLIDNISAQFVTFLIGIMLARLLSPSDYGAVGVLSIFIALANVFVDCGFGKALIRKVDRTEADLSTAFYFNIIVGIVAYGILFALSPFIAEFFKMPIVEDLLKVLGLCVFFGSLCVVQNAIMTAKLDIKTQTIISLATQIPMGGLAIFLALRGFGAWTLAIQQAGSSCLRTILLWYVAKWRPALTFSKDSFHYLFHFGWKLLSASLIGTFFDEIYSFIVGKLLGAKELGLFTKSKTLSQKPRDIVTSVINRVVLPIMVETQGDTDRIRNVYRRLIQLVCFAMFPIMFTCIVAAKPLILILITAKWASAILLFQIFCFGFAWGPIGGLNLNLLELLNRTDIALKLEFIKKPICLTMILVSIPFGLKGIVIGASLYNVVGTIINMSVSKKLLNYSYQKQFSDIGKYLIIAAIGAGLALFVTQFADNLWIALFLGLTISFLVYAVLCWIFKVQALREAFDILKKYKEKK